MPFTEWAEPCSAKEAFTRRRMLLAEIGEIQCQLGDRMKKFNAYEPGEDRRQRIREYEGWRSKAGWALENRLQQLRYIKEWIFEHNVFEEEEETVSA